MSSSETEVRTDGTDARLPPGVIVGGPAVAIKNVESRFLLAFFWGGTAAGLWWAFARGLGTVEIATFAGMLALTTFGIGAGMHRLLVHRSFRCGPAMRVFFCAIAQMAVQGSILKWVSTHRRHHRYADRPGDPHSPYYDGHGRPYLSALKGMLHAHGGWVQDDVLSDPAVYAKDILADPIAMFFTRTRWVWYALSGVGIPGAIGYAAGGLHDMAGCVLFSGLFRVYLQVLLSQLTGSVCHAYGYRRFEMDDDSTNELVSTILTFGEGLHNNHHRHPRDAYLSHAWYEVDLNGLIILGLARVGLVRDVFDGGRRRTAVGAADVPNGGG